MSIPRLTWRSPVWLGAIASLGCELALAEVYFNITDLDAAA